MWNLNLSLNSSNCNLSVYYSSYMHECVVHVTHRNGFNWRVSLRIFNFCKTGETTWSLKRGYIHILYTMNSGSHTKLYCFGDRYKIMRPPCIKHMYIYIYIHIHISLKIIYTSLILKLKKVSLILTFTIHAKKLFLIFIKYLFLFSISPSLLFFFYIY